MVNRIRGEVPIRLEKKQYTLCLTLGALAEIESGLGVESLLEADERLAKPKMADLIVILGALLRGGGHDLNDQDLAAMQIDLAEAVEAIAKTFRLAFPGQTQRAPDASLKSENALPEKP